MPLQPFPGSILNRPIRVCVSHEWVHPSSDRLPSDLRDVKMQRNRAGNRIELTNTEVIGSFRYVYLFDGNQMLFWYDLEHSIEPGCSVSLPLFSLTEE